MKNSKNVCTSKDGYSVESLLNWAYFHDCSSQILFDSEDPWALFTAGYLCALTIELILKAWQLHVHKQFVKTHQLKKLVDDISELKLSKEMQVILEEIDKLSDLRFPWGSAASNKNKNIPNKRARHGVVYPQAEEMKDDFINALADQMPEDLNLIYEKIFFQSHGMYSPK